MKVFIGAFIVVTLLSVGIVIATEMDITRNAAITTMWVVATLVAAVGLGLCLQAFLGLKHRNPGQATQTRRRAF